MSRHPYYKGADEPRGQFEQRLDDVETGFEGTDPATQVNTDRAFQREIDEIARRDDEYLPINKVVKWLLIVGSVALVLVILVSCLFAALASRAADRIAQTAPSLSLPSLPFSSQGDGQEGDDAAETTSSVEGTSWALSYDEAASQAGLADDVELEFGENGTGRMSSSGLSSQFVWQEIDGKAVAYGAVEETVLSGGEVIYLGFESATFLLRGDVLTMESWKGAGGQATPAITFMHSE